MRTASSAHDDEPWIVTLVDYIQRLPSLNPDLRTIGICFGQQTISRAYGTMPGPNEKGWEIGVHNIELTEHGRKVFAGRTQLVRPLLSPAPATTVCTLLTSLMAQNIHQMHRDNVPSVPEGFELLGSTDKCPVHGIVKYRDGVSPADATLEDVRIVALQGE